MTDNDPTTSTPPQMSAQSSRLEPDASQPAEDPGYLTETGQAVGEDGSVAPIIGGLPAVEGSAWDIGAPLEDRGATWQKPDQLSESPAAEEEEEEEEALTSTTITADASVATLINVFSVRPERQRELVDVLVRATEEVMQYLPGFVSANIHASTDGLRVINYAQWETAAAFHGMLADPAAQKHMSEAAAIADGFDPHLHDVESVHHR